MAQTAPITDADPSVEEMEARVARFHELKPTADYVDSAIPGCERTTLRVLGQPPGAPLAAEGFHMSIVRCEPGKAAPLHNHLTQEVFVALTGRWEVFWGPAGARKVVLEQWDTVSVPPGVSRGFKNVSSEPAYLIGMASGQDPGMSQLACANAGCSLGRWRQVAVVALGAAKCGSTPRSKGTPTDPDNNPIELFEAARSG